LLIIKMENMEIAMNVPGAIGFPETHGRGPQGPHGR
jgi:hypothetical protein